MSPLHEMKVCTVPGPRESRAAFQPDSDHHRILVVDDEPNILSSIRRLLRREPFEILTAGSGDEALRLMERYPAHVVVSDYRMPGMTGVELLRHMQPRWPDAVRIILSGYSEVKVIISAINEGAIYKFISKPWNDEELLLHIRGALERYELVQENRRMTAELAEQNFRLRGLGARVASLVGSGPAGADFICQVLGGVHAGIIIVDGEGRILLANAQAGVLVGRPEAALIGMPAAEVLPESLNTTLYRGEPAAVAAGRELVGGRSVEFRVGPLNARDRRCVTALTLWEPLPELAA